MTGTVVLPCVCDHKYQNETYGNGKRLHNYKYKGDATCTICGTVKILDKSKAK